MIVAAATAITLGVHLASWHAPSTYERTHVTAVDVHTRQPIAWATTTYRYHTATPGLYVRLPNGLTAGAYSNSYGNPSAYAGWTWETPDRRFALTVGAVSGYAQGRLRPLVAPSMRLGLAPHTALRIAGAPKFRGGAAVLHLALEFDL
jgi:hypothetical protein